jgi:hypothetical protein
MILGFLEFAASSTRVHPLPGRRVFLVGVGKGNVIMGRSVGSAWMALAVCAAACSDSGGGEGTGGVGAAGVDGTTTGATGGGSGGGGAAAAAAGGATGATGGTTDGAGESGTSGGSADGGATFSGDGGGVTASYCNGTCACSDGMDNDGDGAADGEDIECTGPQDDDEDTFATGMSGDNRDNTWQDCFFDGDSGHGNDGCMYRTGCLTGEIDPSDADCEVSATCIERCQPATPNGCDCFGCCTVSIPAVGEVHVLFTSACQAENLDACTECTPTATQCTNECGRCELCPGKTVDDLPDDCGTPPATGGSGGAGGTGTGGAGGNPPPDYTCDDGVPTCTTTSDCPSGRYCSYGCCLVILL